MGLTKSDRFFVLTLTPGEFKKFDRAVRHITRADDITFFDMIGKEESDFMFDLEEMLVEVRAKTLG